MRTIIAGSRCVTNYNIIKTAIRKAVEYGIKPSCIISGGARGPDKLGERFAQEFGFPLEIFYADWDQFGKRAGYLRNEEMSRNADALIAIYDGTSKGTKHMIDIAKRDGLYVFVYEVL